jgi:hypothetical protein
MVSAVAASLRWLLQAHAAAPLGFSSDSEAVLEQALSLPYTGHARAVSSVGRAGDS